MIQIIKQWFNIPFDNEEFYSSEYYARYYTAILSSLQLFPPLFSKAIEKNFN